FPCARRRAEQRSNIDDRDHPAPPLVGLAACRALSRDDIENPTTRFWSDRHLPKIFSPEKCIRCRLVRLPVNTRILRDISFGRAAKTAARSLAIRPSREPLNSVNDCNLMGNVILLNEHSTNENH